MGMVLSACDHVDKDDDSDNGSDTDSDIDTDMDVDTDTDTDTDTDADTDTDSDSDSDTDADSDSDSDTDTDTDTGTGDECDPDGGVTIECWWLDANEDGVTCTNDSDCSPHTCEKDLADMGGSPSPDGEGLCRCTYNSDDFAGGFGDCPGEGVCSPDGICGPSYCNGHLVPSCWGGCELQLFGDGDQYDKPADYCENELTSAPQCCEGPFPDTPGTEATGYCSSDESCATGG